MPSIKDIVAEIEDFAPVDYQEAYDNARLITGNKNWECTGVLLSLDCIESTVEEAIEKNCNLIIAHHPIVFKGLRSITGKNYVERTVIQAIKHDIAIYACHTNLDNMRHGVSQRMAQKLGLENTKVLAPKTETILQLQTYVPSSALDVVRKALFEAGAGQIGNYSQCSFSQEGMGSFMGNEQANPTVGQKETWQLEPEVKLEVLVPKHLQQTVLSELKNAHPYEEVAYYFLPTMNENQDIGSGIIGDLPTEMSEIDFLHHVKDTFQASAIRHTNLLGTSVKKVALCGGAGSFLLPVAIGKGADVYISADFKYHEFFDADNQILIADIGHYESEQFTQEIFHELITKKYSNFAVHFSERYTNPIKIL